MRPLYFEVFGLLTWEWKGYEGRTHAMGYSTPERALAGDLYQKGAIGDSQVLWNTYYSKLNILHTPSSLDFPAWADLTIGSCTPPPSRKGKIRATAQVPVLLTVASPSCALLVLAPAWRLGSLPAGGCI